MATRCGRCDKPNALSFCARCMQVAYCNKSCQVQDWKSGGHKLICKQVNQGALVHRKLNKQSLAANGASCFICLEGKPCPVMLGCGCRGNAGFAHPKCVEAAAMADGIDSIRWLNCMTCGQAFTGAMDMSLVIRRWARLCCKPVSDGSRMTAATNLASALNAQGQHEFAEGILRRTLGVQRRVLGQDHPNALTTANNLANALKDQGEYAKAVPIYSETLRAMKRVLGHENVNTLSMAMNFAIVLHELGHVSGATELYRETLKTQKKVLGEEHQCTLMTATNLASVLYAQGKHVEAMEILKTTLEVQGRVLGNDHPDTVLTAKRLNAASTTTTRACSKAQ
jgi:tetratricopeptide (TPR) repeat protein